MSEDNNDYILVESDQNETTKTSWEKSIEDKVKEKILKEEFIEYTMIDGDSVLMRRNFNLNEPGVIKSTTSYKATFLDFSK